MPVRQPLWGPRVRVHAPAEALPGFSFDGIAVYADRALTASGGVIFVTKGLETGPAKGYLEYLHSIGIGVDRAIEVDMTGHSSLYEAILACPKARRELLRLVAVDGYKIEFFNTREGAEESFLKRLGLLDALDLETHRGVWDRHVVSAPSNVADSANNKGRARLRASRDQAHMRYYPPHLVLDGARNIWRGFLAMRRRYPGHRFFLKVPAWATGMGQIRTRRRRDVARFILKHWRRLRNIVLEIDRGNHRAMSINRRVVSGQVQDEYATTQLMVESVDDEGTSRIVDLGRVLSTHPEELPGLDADDVAWLQDAANALLTPFVEEGASTTNINLDAMRSYTTGEREACEINLRETFGSVNRDILLQLARNMVADKLTLLQVKCRPARARDFAAVCDELGETLFTLQRGRGILPMMLRCLGAEEPYIYIIGLGEGFEDALDEVFAALRKLGDHAMIVDIEAAVKQQPAAVVRAA